MKRLDAICLKLLPICFALAISQAQAQLMGVASSNIDNSQTQIVTLMGTNSAHVSYNLSTNQVVTISTVDGSVNNFSITFYNGLMTYPGVGHVFTGATNISFFVAAPGAGAPSFVTLTVLTPSTNTTSVTPVNSVVIPTDAKGPVQIVLESSSDLINWISSLPGIYGNAYSNRFFRVRAIAQ